MFRFLFEMHLFLIYYRHRSTPECRIGASSGMADHSTLSRSGAAACWCQAPNASMQPQRMMRGAIQVHRSRPTGSAEPAANQSQHRAARFRKIRRPGSAQDRSPDALTCTDRGSPNCLDSLTLRSASI